MRLLFAVALAFAASAIAAGSLEAKCRQKGERPQVFVKGKTSIRRGNGLNYPVSKFLEEGKCMALSEVSLDEAWVLVEDESNNLGWVPVSALDGESRDLLPSVGKKQKGPIGSGQERGFVYTKGSASLLSSPDPQGVVRKVLPAGARLLGLAITEDGRWVQVRDDRGETGWVGARGLKDESETLAGLPVADNGIKTGMKSSGGGGGKSDDEDDEVNRDDRPKRKKRVRPKEDRQLVADAGDAQESGAEEEPAPKAKQNRRMSRPDDEDQTIATSIPQATGLELKATVLAETFLPRESFDSNGRGGNRRYLVRSLSIGGGLQAIAEPLGVFRARLAYNFALLTGLNPPGTGTKSISGQEHYLDLMFGYPIQIGSRVKLIPELGYAFGLFAMEPYLPGSNTPQFFSSHTHGLAAGFAAFIAFSESVGLDLDISALAGTTIAYPFVIGSAGIAVGMSAGAGLRIGVGGGAAIIVAYRYRYRQTPFSGMAKIDPTITSATITHLDNGIGAGLLLTF